MKFSRLPIAGARLVEALPVADNRGHFSRLYCRQAFAAAGLHFNVEQTNTSFNHLAGTLRGLHFTWPPSQEAKLVRCARGRLVDVLIDLRPHSSTFGHHTSITLDANDHQTLLIPAGVAHGFQTLLDNTEVHYMMNEAYRPHLSDGVRFDDPLFGIRWPLPVSSVSDRDRQYPDFDAQAHRQRFDAAPPGLKADA